MAKPFARKFYKSQEWQNAREYVLARDRFLCRHCGNPAEEVHHIQHLTPENILNPAVSLHADNLLSLCRDCHFEEHDADRNKRSGDTPTGFYFDSDGQIQKIK